MMALDFVGFFVAGFFAATFVSASVFGRFLAGSGEGLGECLLTPFVFGASAVSSAFRLPLNDVVCTPFVKVGVVDFAVFFVVEAATFVALVFGSAFTFGSAAFLLAAAVAFLGGMAP